MKKREKKEKESEMKKKRSFIPFIQKKHIERGKSKAKKKKNCLGKECVTLRFVVTFLLYILVLRKVTQIRIIYTWQFNKTSLFLAHLTLLDMIFFKR